MLRSKEHYWKYVWIIYAGAIVLYLFAAARMSVPVHLEVDEDTIFGYGKVIS